ncbi:MAG: thioredoxin family protein [Abitibacteriaceae bacterium]|nr:thioredoxin family protein [Abditibacteriaceae bacterium]
MGTLPGSTVGKPAISIRTTCLLILAFMAGGLIGCSTNREASQSTAPGSKSATAPQATEPSTTAPSEDKTGHSKSALAQAPQTPKLTHITWETNYEKALAKAKAANKPVLIDFSTEWCHWCKELDNTTYKAFSVIAESQNFIPVRVDGDKREDLTQRYHVEGFPTIVVVDSSGQRVDSLDGYAEADDFVRWMRSSYNKFRPDVAV